MDLYLVIDKRAKSFLKTTADKFSKFQWQESASGGAWVVKAGFNVPICEVTLGQRVSSKLVGRIYSFEWRWSVSADLGCEHQIAKLRFDGWKKTSRSVRFEGAASSADLISKLNQSETIMSLCLAMEFVSLEIKYLPDSKICEVVCLPSYGDYIWLLIPPVRYANHPTSAEIEGTVLLIEEISKVISSR